MDINSARVIIEKRLQPGEKLIWYDAPSPWAEAGRHIGPLASTAVWIGLVLVLMPPRDLLSPATIVILIATFFCVSALRKVLNSWRTAYGLTDGRVIIAVGDKGPDKSYVAAAFERLERSGNDAYGTIRFDRGRSWGGPKNDIASLWRGGHWRAGLYGIKNPAHVEAEIYQTLLHLKAKERA